MFTSIILFEMKGIGLLKIIELLMAISSLILILLIDMVVVATLVAWFSNKKNLWWSFHQSGTSYMIKVVDFINLNGLTPAGFAICLTIFLIQCYHYENDQEKKLVEKHYQQEEEENQKGPRIHTFDAVKKKLEEKID